MSLSSKQEHLTQKDLYACVLVNNAFGYIMENLTVAEVSNHLFHLKRSLDASAAAQEHL